MYNLIYENPRLDEEQIIYGYTHLNEDGHDTQYDLRVKSFIMLYQRSKIT